VTHIHTGRDFQAQSGIAAIERRALFANTRTGASESVPIGHPLADAIAGDVSASGPRLTTLGLTPQAARRTGRSRQPPLTPLLPTNAAIGGMTAATADIPTARGTDQSRTHVHASTISVRHTPISRKYRRCRRMSCSLAGHGTSVTESTRLSRRISPR